MKQQTLANVRINYYSLKSASIDLDSSALVSNTKNLQLLLISLLNFVHVIYTTKSNDRVLEEMLFGINMINKKLKNSGRNSAISFLRKYESIVNEKSVNTKKNIVLKLKEDKGSINFEKDFPNNISLAYQYFSIYLLFEVVIRTKDSQLIQIFSELVEYILDFYSNNINASKEQSLVILSKFISNILLNF